MIIQEILKKDITRNINGVVKAENNKEATVINELDEYVVTDEVRKHMTTLFDRYAESMNKDTEDMGIWVSGFFGSGKSHLLKMLGYIVDNKEYHGKKATDYFEEKLSDPILEGNILKSSEKTTDVILFNIDNVSDQDTNQNKDSIVLAFQKKFNEHLGFSRDDIKVASFERLLWEKGVFEEFKEKFEEISGDSWESSRRNIDFIAEDFLDTVEELEVQGFSRESAERWLDKEDMESVNPDSFCDYLESYLKIKGKDHRILFLVDEIGQYIGDNIGLMLNLQTIVENLGLKFQGRVWVGVTSQQNIDEILKESNTKRVDFAKIQGRFKTMLSLSSSNIDEVIKKRLLEKREIEKEDLEKLYEKRRVDISNLITFSKDGVTQKVYDNKEDFAEAYPFVGYQFNLLQKVLDKVRNMGHSGKHMSRGERSLLGSFQEAGIKMAEKEVGSLVPFHYFYESIEQFLEDDVRRPFVQARTEKGCNEFQLNVLKLLFLLKGIDDVVAPTIENLTSFMIENIDDNKIELEKNVKSALKKLEKEVLIQKDGDRYYFLTNEEQDINRAIEQEIVDVKDKYKILDEIIFEDIFDEKSIVIEETGNKYLFNRKIDDEIFGRGNGHLDLVIFTPRADEYDHVNMVGTREKNDLIIKLPEEMNYFQEIDTFLKVDLYLKKNRSSQRENIVRIIEAKQRENSTRKKRIINFIEEALKNSVIYIGGHERDLKVKDSKKKIEAGLKSVANFRFKKATLVKRKYDIKRIEGVLSTSFDSNNQLMNINRDLDSNPNKEAILEVKQRIELQKSRGNRVTAKELVDYYTNKPYGWDNMTVNGILAELWAYKLVNVEESGVRITEMKDAIKYLTKTQGKTLEKLVIQPKEEVDTNLLKKVNNLVKRYLPNSKEISVDNSKNDLKDVIGKKIGEVNGYIYEYKNETLPGLKELEEWKELLSEIKDIDGNTEKVLKEFLKFEDDLEDEYSKYDDVKDFFVTSKKEKFIKGKDKIKTIKFYEHYIGAIKESDEYKELISILEDKKPYSKIRLIDDLIKKIEEQEKEIILKEIMKMKDEADRKTVEFAKSVDDKKLISRIEEEIGEFISKLGENINLNTLKDDKKLDNIFMKYENLYRNEIRQEIENLRGEALRSLVDKDNVDTLKNQIEESFSSLIQKTRIDHLKTLKHLIDVAKKDKNDFIAEAEGKAKKKERKVIHKLKIYNEYNLESKGAVEEYFAKLEEELNKLKEEALKAIEEEKIVDIG